MYSIKATIDLITVYVGMPIFICGTIGNLINVLIFWKTRRNPCAFIFLILSITNWAVLINGLLLRILSFGFQIDWSIKNRSWCKVRNAFSAATVLISLTLSCLASIDRFLFSCREQKFRKLSKLPLTIPAVVATIIFWFGHFSPYFIYTELVFNPISGLVSCIIVANQALFNYMIYFAAPVYYALLPTTILIVTGAMTYRNMTTLRAARQRELFQKQLTSMMLVQIPIILCSTLPFVVFSEYVTLSSTIAKSTDRVVIEQLVLNILILLSYTPFSCPFFVFIISSSAFRKGVKALVLCRNTTVVRTNQIYPNSTIYTTNQAVR